MLVDLWVITKWQKKHNLKTLMHYLHTERVISLALYDQRKQLVINLHFLPCFCGRNSVVLNILLTYIHAHILKESDHSAHVVEIVQICTGDFLNCKHVIILSLWSEFDLSVEKMKLIIYWPIFFFKNVQASCIFTSFVLALSQLKPFIPVSDFILISFSMNRWSKWIRILLSVSNHMVQIYIFMVKQF